MPFWLSQILSVCSYAVIGASLGGLYRVMVVFQLFEKIKNVRFADLIRLMMCTAILFPIWSFVFGYLGGDAGFTPLTNQTWLASIGVAIAISSFLVTADK